MREIVVRAIGALAFPFIFVSMAIFAVIAVCSATAVVLISCIVYPPLAVGWLLLGVWGWRLGRAVVLAAVLTCAIPIAQDRIAPVRKPPDYEGLEISVDGRPIRVAYTDFLPSVPLYSARVGGRDVGLGDLLGAVESGTVPLDSEVGRMVLDLDLDLSSPPPEPVIDYGVRSAEAIRTYAEQLGARLGVAVEAPDPRLWADEDPAEAALGPR